MYAAGLFSCTAPKGNSTNSADSFIWVILAIIAACIAATSYISTRLSRQIVNPLEHLAEI